MKNRILFSLIVAVIPFFGFAQIDDMYFVPQKETKVNEDKHPQPQPSVRFQKIRQWTPAQDMLREASGM